MRKTRHTSLSRGAKNQAWRNRGVETMAQGVAE